MRLLFLILVIICVAAASDATVVYRSNTGATCGINCPKIRVWNSTTMIWGSETEIGTNTGSAIRVGRIAFSPLNQKRIIVTENNNGELDLYVSWTGSIWDHSRNITKIWNASPAVHYRGFDIAFEAATGNALIIISPLDSRTNCDLAYFSVLKNETKISNPAYTCIDDNTSAANIQYGWVSVDSNPLQNSKEITAVGEDRTGNDVNAWVWNGSAWGNRQEVTIDASSTGDFEALGVKYAADGSKAMVVAGTGTVGVVNYQYWNGTKWSAATSLGDVTSSTDDIRQILITADPASDDLMVIEVTSDGGMSSSYWNGASWANTIDIDTTIDGSVVRPASFAWNISGSKGYLAWDTDVTGTTISNKTFTAGAWGTNNTVPGYAGTGAWMKLTTNPTATDSIAIIGLRLNNAFDIGSFTISNSGTYKNLGNSSITADTTVTTFEAMNLAFIRATDNNPPSVSSTGKNASSVNTNEVICINASAVDQNGAPISQAMAQISFPNGTVTNITLSDSGCNAGAVGDDRYGGTVNVGPTTGTLTINTVFANDSFGNMGKQSPYPNLQVSIGSGGAFVETTISSTTLGFGSLDPGTLDNPATQNPIVLTNTLNSNTAVDIYLSNTNMTSGGNRIAYGNLSVSTTNNPATGKAMAGPAFINGTIANSGFIENLAIGSGKTLYFWQSIPAGQPSGAYSGTVVIHAVADGQNP